MTIQIASTTICDGPDRTADKSAGPSGLTVVGDNAAQPARYLRSAEGGFFDRGNQTHTVTFGIKRQCASVAAAEAWALMLCATVPRSGTVTFGLGATSYRLLDCVLKPQRIAHVGVTVSVDYIIQGGKMELVTT